MTDGRVFNCAGVFLHRGTKPEDVPARLKLYEEIRKDRVTTLQNRSRVHAKGPEKGQLWNGMLILRWISSELGGPRAGK